MESIDTAINCMKPGIFMASVDLKDAFFSIPMCAYHQKYLKFCFNNIFYKFICMPMGYGPSMRIFTKVLKPIFAYLRDNKYESAVYVDDTLLFGNTITECNNNIWATVNLLRELGFTVHAEKSVLYPTQEITFLGFVLNSINMTISLTEAKKEKIHTFCLDILDNPRVTIRKLACLIGKLVSSFPAVPYGKLYYRDLERVKVKALKDNGGKFDEHVTLNKPALEEVLWWCNNIRDSYHCLIKKQISRIIYTDASRLGWGITSDQISNGGK